MEHHLAYSELSEEARHAWDTLHGLPLTTSEQHRHAWGVLCAEVAGLAEDPRPALHVFADQSRTTGCEMYVSGAELAALRVLVAWLKANDRAGRMREAPVYPDVAEAILGQLGEMPWPNVWEPEYLNQIETGGVLWLHPRIHAPALSQLLESTLRRASLICPGWPPAARAQLIGLLCDVWYWLQAMLSVYDTDATP